uniref:N-acetyltransferase domain-containing protein n=1 Tax=Glossina brevipalpis TaxID=37001 RepID=A0A1A9WRU4_9MUSC
MSAKCLKLICNGEFEIVKITEDLYDEAVELFKNYFVKYENLSIACNLRDTDKTRNEMEKFIRHLLKDNISFAARHIPTQQLAAMCINKITNPAADIKTDHIFEILESPNMDKIGEIMHHLETSFDIYKEWQVKCIIELTFLSTRTEFTRRGLALMLAEFTLNYGHKLKEEDSKETLELPAHLKGQRPEAITSVFTSRFSQRVGEKLGFVTLSCEEYAKFSFEGKSFAEKIDPQHKYIIFAAKRL